MTTERSRDLKFDKGTMYIVYFHTHVHVHIEKMGNLSKSKLKLYNKLRSCALFAPRAPPTKVEQSTPRCKFTPRVYICTGVYIVHMNKA